jgi:hypothetical protein
MLQLGMDKTTAISLLGGTPKLAAEAIGISVSAVGQWPEVLPNTIADRVQAAIARRHLAPEVLGIKPPAPAKA